MKALSIHQPWAWAILHAGKSVENRSWRTCHRGPLLVHASKSRASYDAQDPAAWLERYGVALPAWDDLTKGAIIGVVDVVDCVRVEEIPATPWAMGPWCWVLAHPRVLTEAIVWKGQQGLFTVPDGVLSE